MQEFVPGIEFMSWLGSQCRRAPRAPSSSASRARYIARSQLPDVQKKLYEGGNVATPLSPQEFRDLSRAKSTWRKVIAAAGIKAG